MSNVQHNGSQTFRQTIPLTLFESITWKIQGESLSVRFYFWCLHPKVFHHFTPSLYFLNLIYSQYAFILFRIIEHCPGSIPLLLQPKNLISKYCIRRSIIKWKGNLFSVLVHQSGLAYLSGIVNYLNKTSGFRFDTFSKYLFMNAFLKKI
jgi:hypothetical protein